MQQNHANKIKYTNQQTPTIWDEYMISSPADKLSKKLLYKGLKPDCFLNIAVYDYQATKVEIKREINLDITVYQINIIVLAMMGIILKLSSTQKHFIDSDELSLDAANIFKEKKHQLDLQKIIQKQLGIKLSELEIIKSTETLLKNSSLSQGLMVHYGITLNRYNQFIYRYNSTKSKLDKIFGKPLTTEEYEVLAECWYYYASFAQDIDNPNNWFKETIKEQLHVIEHKIKALKPLIKLYQTSNEGYTQHTRFISIDIDNKDSASYFELELMKLESVRKKLSMRNGAPLHYQEMMNNAYFSVLFYSELLGLHLRDKRNIFLDVLLAIQGLDNYPVINSEFEHDPHADKKEKDRKQASKIYGRYRAFKKCTPFIDSITNAVNNKPLCLKTKLSAIEKFRTLLPKLDINNVEGLYNPLSTQVNN